jgi:phytoene dehydrogenase-like protein
VGSGLSGLVAAQQLQQFGKKILVLEAQSIIGGRIQT